MTNTKRRPKKCSFIAGGDRCERDAVSGGLCHGHDAQAPRHPDQDLAPLHAAKDRLCEFEGCDRDPHARGLCAAHYQQVLRRQPLSPISELPYPEGLSDDELLAWICSDKASTLAENGCRIWNGCTDLLRYGRIPRWGKHELVHRFVYITANGVDRATFGDSVHHACHNRGCVNIDHLEAATARENTLEMHERHSLQKTIGLQRKAIALKDRLIAQLQVESASLEDGTKQLDDNGID